MYLTITTNSSEKAESIRKFSVLPKMGSAPLEIIETFFERPIPNILKDYLKVYAGSSIKENTFIDDQGNIWEIATFINGIEFIKLSKKFKDSGWGDWLIFGYDYDGSHFCLNMGLNYNSIYIKKSTDRDDFLKIADSFEDFITRLKKPDTECESLIKP